MEKLWSVLVHLGTNMWYEEGNCRGLLGDPTDTGKIWKSPASSVMRFDEKTWEKYREELVRAGVNMVLFDLGEGLVYPSHPELASQGAWTPERMAREIEVLKSLGVEAVPKLNFSATHDAWMGEYSRRVSTPEYYQVCRELIDDVCAIFHPRFFHIGFDEEVYENQKEYDYVVIRQYDQWWEDLRRISGYVEANGARAMMWSDFAREHTEEFIQKCPKSIVQCVWYYFTLFEGELPYANQIRIRPYKALAEAGFDVMASGSLAYEDQNLACLARYCVDNVPHERLLGFLQTTWESVTPEWEELLRRSASSVEEIRQELGGRFH